MKKLTKTVAIVTTAVLLAGVCFAQRRGFGGGFGGGGYGGGRRGGSGPIWYTEGGREMIDERVVKTAREIDTHGAGGAPNWTNSASFSKDAFTFVRIIRDSNPEAPRGAAPWTTDFPDSDLNLSFRLQQMTSIKTDPDGRVMRLTNPDLFNYPWIYMVEVGSLSLREPEVAALRKYLTNGGVLMVDDFWGEWQWDIFAGQMQRVLPDKQFVELPMDHPIFSSVIPLKGPKNSLQTPNVGVATSGIWNGSGVTWEQNHPSRDGGYEDTREMHVRAILDDKGRIMVIATHNCDNGDAWEREGDNDEFFHAFSEKRGFPLGINIIFYIMTH